MKEKHQKLLQYYHDLHGARRSWFDWRVRLAVMAIGVAVAYLAYTFFESLYHVQIVDANGGVAVVSELLFKIFMAGAIFGMILFGLITEGEYLVGLRRAVYSVVGEGSGDASPARQEAIPKPSSKGRKKRK